MQTICSFQKCGSQVEFWRRETVWEMEGVDSWRTHALEELAIAYNLKFFLIPAAGAERKIKLWEIQISVRSTPGGL